MTFEDAVRKAVFDSRPEFAREIVVEVSINKYGVTVTLAGTTFSVVRDTVVSAVPPEQPSEGT